MVIRFFLAILALVALMWYLSWYRGADKDQRNRSLISVALYGLATVLLLLVVTGRIPWLFALFSAAIPWINRALMVKKIWNRVNNAENSHTTGDQSVNNNSKMTREEAYKILNIEPGATEEKIIDAHRKLVQKVHPDRGGSDFLTTQVNQAKDTLLNS